MKWRRWQMTVWLVVVEFSTQLAAGVTVKIDYTYDTTSFFGSGNPQGTTGGAQAKAALESAASFYSDILTDSFSEIVTPPPFHSSTFDGVATWQWTENF